MKRNYHTLDNRGKANERKLVEFLAQNGQQILPMVELITESRMAIDDLVNAMGRATIETVLQLSAEQVAGPPQQGRPGMFLVAHVVKESSDSGVELKQAAESVATTNGPALRT